MNYRAINAVGVISVLSFLATPANLDAQRKDPANVPARQGIQTAMKVGDQTYQSNDAGRCTHAPVASIYKTVAELWSVQQSSNGRSLSLSFWRPKDGSGDMVTLSVRTGGTAADINTVRGGGQARGVAKVTLGKSGDGGVFTVEGKTQEGVPINGTIKCDRFAPHMAEGGL